MNPQTYDVKLFETQEKADEEGYTVPLQHKDMLQVQGMNRAQRRAWLSKKRKNKRART